MTIQEALDMHRRYRDQMDPRGAEVEPDEALLMQEFDIRFDGQRYLFAGYRYERLADAVNYAKLMRLRPAQEPPDASSSGSSAIEPVPSPADLARMAALDVRYAKGLYHFGLYRYERMQDAENYARLCRARGWR
jgi:hypothetical protein